MKEEEEMTWHIWTVCWNIMCCTTRYVLKCLSGFNGLLYVVSMFLHNDSAGNKALPWPWNGSVVLSQTKSFSSVVWALFTLILCLWNEYTAQKNDLADAEQRRAVTYTPPVRHQRCNLILFKLLLVGEDVTVMLRFLSEASSKRMNQQKMHLYRFIFYQRCRPHEIEIQSEVTSGHWDVQESRKVREKRRIQPHRRISCLREAEGEEYGAN